MKPTLAAAALALLVASAPAMTAGRYLMEASGSAASNAAGE
jgi:hypothetical protein